MEDPAGAESLGGVMYRYLSAKPNGSLHGLLKRSHRVEGMPAGRMGTLRSHDSAGVLTAYIATAERQIACLGWNGPAWGEWKLDVWRRIPALPARFSRPLMARSAFLSYGLGMVGPTSAAPEGVPCL